jgi:hypothetical protein
MKAERWSGSKKIQQIVQAEHRESKQDQSESCSDASRKDYRDVYMGRATVFRSRPSIGRKPDGPVPKGLTGIFTGTSTNDPFQ